jgi:hypothetical protein
MRLHGLQKNYSHNNNVVLKESYDQLNYFCVVVGLVTKCKFTSQLFEISYYEKFHVWYVLIIFCNFRNKKVVSKKDWKKS